jgi:hypothetical protein
MLVFVALALTGFDNVLDGAKGISWSVIKVFTGWWL